jgi:hypothetical protein
MDHASTAFPLGPGSAVEEPDLIMACKVSAVTVTLGTREESFGTLSKVPGRQFDDDA